MLAASRDLRDGKGSRPAVPLVVIGALKAGGSGKTSVTLALARAFTEQGLKVAILAYRLGPGRDRVLVEVGENDDWRQASEEALMLRRDSGARVFATRDRARAWRALHDPGISGDRPFDLILSDDGFQDPRLAGALRILLVEAGSRPGLFDLLPAGPYRETRHARRRADIVLEGPYPEVGNDPDTGNAAATVTGKDQGFPPAHRFWRSLLLPAGVDRGRPWIALCGLGDNIPFLADLGRKGIKPIAVLEGRNHAAWPEGRIAAAARRHPGAGFLCTRKDFLKLDAALRERFSIHAVEQSIRLAAAVPIAVDGYRRGGVRLPFWNA